MQKVELYLKHSDFLLGLKRIARDYKMAKKSKSKVLMVCVVLTIVYATFILTNIYAQEDMLVGDFLNFMIPAIVPWAVYFIWKAVKKK